MLWVILLVTGIVSLVIYWRKQKFKAMMEEAIQFARQHGNVPLDYSEPLFTKFKVALSFFKDEQVKTISFLEKVPESAQYGWSIINCYLVDLLQNKIIEDFTEQPELTEDERNSRRSVLIDELNNPDQTRGEREETLYYATHLALFHEDTQMQEQLAKYYQDQEDYKNAITFYALAGNISDSALYQSHVLLNAHPSSRPSETELELYNYYFLLTQYRRNLPFLPQWEEQFTDPDSIHLSWGSAID